MGGVVAVDGDNVVGSTMSATMRLTVPGGAEVLATGISGVTFAPTHRRRGALRAMYTRVHAENLAAGIPLAVLTASEGGIYGRFGYGPATVANQIGVDRRIARLRRSTPDPGGVVGVALDEAERHVPAIYDRWRKQTVGAQQRPESAFADLFADEEADRRGGTRLFAFLQPDGYALYPLSAIRRRPGRPASRNSQRSRRRHTRRCGAHCSASTSPTG